MCGPFTTHACPGLAAGIKDLFSKSADKAAEKVTGSIMDAVIGGLAEAVQEAVEWMAKLLTVWILVPSTDLCPHSSGDWISRCNSADFPAQQLRGYMIPLTVLIVVGGLIWQGITMTITRKGEPLIQAVRGVWTTALWGGIGIAGTHLALKAGDSYSMWILDKAIFSGSAKPPDETFSAALGALLLPNAAVAPFVIILLGIVVMFVALLQAILMIFREGAVVILAGLLQLAAAGTITRGTSSWLQRVMGWTLAMVAYKPMAATVYATAFVLMGQRDPGGTGRNFLMGLAVLALSVVAMPVMIKFFSWTTGGLANSGGGVGMLAATGAAGMHAIASMRGVGGSSAVEHARYLDTTLGAGVGGSAAPTGAATSVKAAMPLASAGSAGAGAAGAGVSAGTAAAGTAGTAGAAAAGPAAPIVIAGVAAARAGTAAVKAGVSAMDNATQGSGQ